MSDALKGLELPPAYATFGHNNPDEVPLNEQERDRVVAYLAEAQTVAQSGDDGAPSKVLAIWKKIRPKLASFGVWTLDRLNDFFTEAFREAGKHTGKLGLAVVATRLLLTQINIHSITLEAERIIQVLQHLQI